MISYPKRFVGKYVRVDMLGDEGWEFGKLSEVTDHYVVLKMSKHLREFFRCKEKWIERRVISSITTFEKEKEKELEMDFMEEMMGEMDEHEEPEENHRVELG